MKGTTLICEEDFTLDDKIDVLWHLSLVVDHGFEAADIDRIQVVSPGLCTL